jgi:hypothetical protein
VVRAHPTVPRRQLFFFATRAATNTPNSLQAKLLHPDQQRPLGLQPEAVEYAEHLLGAEGARAHSGIASYALFAYPIIRRTRVISWFDPSDRQKALSRRIPGFARGETIRRATVALRPFLLFPAPRRLGCDQVLKPIGE